MADEFHHHRKDIRESDVSVMKLRWLTANDIINQVSSTSQSRNGRIFRDSLAVRKYVFTHTQLTSHDLKGMDIALEVGGGNVGESELKTLKELLTELLGCATLDIRLVDDGDCSVTGWTLPPLPSVKRLIERPAVVDDDNDDESIDADRVVESIEEVEILTPHLEDGTEFRFQTQKTAKSACLRCRLFRAEADATLCTRCLDIVGVS